MKAISKQYDRCDRSRPEWFELEMATPLQVAADTWVHRNGGTYVRYDDVIRAEQRAYGHANWASKLALYVAELIVGV